ncbi:hypothetical protein [Saccharothrix deserti]|uniref:hypothetical protein n=1 Tax=Saccharothrix deserti TaxID=2593674 RepID=UPI00131D2E4A|nr:hypothetical protein [Saccharothrix deserti]
MVANGFTTPLTLAMLKHSLADPGTLVAQNVAVVLIGAALTDHTRALLRDLKDHPSATVRHTVNAATNDERDWG